MAELQGHRSGLRSPRSATLATDRERQVQKLLEAEGWVVFDVRGRRLGGKQGRWATSGTTVCDFVALRAGGEIGDTQYHANESMMVEVKSTERSPWVAFSRAPRRALIEAAEKAGAEAWLYHWPPHGELACIPSDKWPKL